MIQLTKEAALYLVLQKRMEHYMKDTRFRYPHLYIPAPESKPEDLPKGVGNEFVYEIRRQTGVLTETTVLDNWELLDKIISKRNAIIRAKIDQREVERKKMRQQEAERKWEQKREEARRLQEEEHRLQEIARKEAEYRRQEEIARKKEWNSQRVVAWKDISNRGLARPCVHYRCQGECKGKTNKTQYHSVCSDCGARGTVAPYGGVTGGIYYGSSRCCICRGKFLEPEKKRP